MSTIRGIIILGGIIIIIGGGLFVMALGLLQMMGIDKDKMHYKSGKLTLPTKKQIKYAFISTIGLLVIVAIFMLVNR